MIQDLEKRGDNWIGVRAEKFLNREAAEVAIKSAEAGLTEISWTERDSRTPIAVASTLRFPYDFVQLPL